MKRTLRGSLSVHPPGIKIFLLTFMLITTPTLTSCIFGSDTEEAIEKSNGEEPNGEEETYNLDDPDENEEETYNLGDPDENEVTPITGKFSYPRKATAWSTESLLITEAHPSYADLNVCSQDIDALSSEATNDYALKKLPSKMEAIVSDNPLKYHWCFFYSVHVLDKKLIGTEIPLKEKGKLFYTKMRGLQALSLALDTEKGTDVYFSYLRKRYIDISKNIFGRHIAVTPTSSDEIPDYEAQRNTSLVKDEE